MVQNDLNYMYHYENFSKKYKVQKYVNYVKTESVRAIFRNNVLALRNTDSKLLLYSCVKREYSYEKYLDLGCHDLRNLTKFRMFVQLNEEDTVNQNYLARSGYVHFVSNELVMSIMF